MKKVNIRTALPEDTPLIYDFIMKLAQYEKKEKEVKATPELLYESLFVRRQGEEKKAALFRGDAGEYGFYDVLFVHHPAEYDVFEQPALYKSRKRRGNIRQNEFFGSFVHGKGVHVPKVVAVGKNARRHDFLQGARRRRFARAHRSVDKDEVHEASVTQNPPDVKRGGAFSSGFSPRRRNKTSGAGKQTAGGPHSME